MLRSSLRETATIMIGWVNSCKTTEQIGIVQTALDNSFLPLYEGQQSLMHEYSRVYKAITDKKVELMAENVCEN